MNLSIGLGIHTESSIGCSNINNMFSEMSNKAVGFPSEFRDWFIIREHFVEKFIFGAIHRYEGLLSTPYVRQRQPKKLIGVTENYSIGALELDSYGMVANTHVHQNVILNLRRRLFAVTTFNSHVTYAYNHPYIFPF